MSKAPATMSDRAARPSPALRLAGYAAALARETSAAFEALARRQYDAPWQRLPIPPAPRAH